MGTIGVSRYASTGNEDVGASAGAEAHAGTEVTDSSVSAEVTDTDVTAEASIGASSEAKKAKKKISKVFSTKKNKKKY